MVRRRLVTTLQRMAGEPYEYRLNKHKAMELSARPCGMRWAGWCS